MQQMLAGIALTVVGFLVFLLGHTKSSFFWNLIDMKLLRKVVGEKNTTLVLTFVSIAFILTGIVVFFTAF